MTVLWVVLVLAVIATICLAMWCAWTATRLDRVHLLQESASAALAEALVRRSALATDTALSQDLDPASSLALLHAAAAARKGPRDDWQAQSDLSAVIRILRDTGSVREHDDLLERASRDVSMARRIHNDIAVRAQALHQRRRVRWFRLAGHAAAPQTIEFDVMDAADWSV